MEGGRIQFKTGGMLRSAIAKDLFYGVLQYFGVIPCVAVNNCSFVPIFWKDLPLCPYKSIRYRQSILPEE
jgi:hypothetical protein